MSNTAWTLVLAALVRMERDAIPVRGQWQKVLPATGSGWALKDTRNEFEDLSLTAFHNYDSILPESARKPIHEAFDRDAVFGAQNGASTVFHMPYTVITDVAASTGKIRGKSILIDKEAALKRFEEYRNDLARDVFEIEASCRLIGVKSTQRIMTLPDNISVVRLNRRQLSQRQPIYDIRHHDLFSLENLLKHNVEIRTPITISVDQGDDMGILALQSTAEKIARERFNRVVQSVQFLKSGTVSFTHVTLSRIITHCAGYSKPLRSIDQWHREITIRKADLPPLVEAYNLLAAADSSDPVLARALRRFLMARRRSFTEDKLVDLIVALEAILLSGKNQNQELSYRFAVNGANLLGRITKSDKITLHRKFLCAYRARSQIVHGSSDKSKLGRVLRKAGFSQLTALIAFLEDSLRVTIQHLSQLPTGDRPYNKDGEWENMIFT